MKIFTLAQEIALFSAVALAMKTHSLGSGIAVFVIVEVIYGVPAVTLQIMRRVRNYKKRLAGMEAYRAQMFASQYGTKAQTPKTRQPSYSSNRSQVYTLR